MYNFQKISFYFLLFALASTIGFTSCSDDEMVDPDPNEMEMCDSFAISLTITPDSTIAANIFGGTEPFTYSWSDGSSSAEIEFFTDASYGLTVTDDNGCTAEGTIDLEGQPPVDDCAGFSATIVDTIYNDGAILQVYATAGGTFPFTYEWSTNETTNTIEVSDAGTYTATITDSNGCTAVATFDYNPSNDPCAGFVVDIDVSPDSLANNGTYILNAYPEGGTAPFSYIWNNGSTDVILYEISTGTYGVSVTDANGCIGADEVVVE